MVSSSDAKGTSPLSNISTVAVRFGSLPTRQVNSAGLIVNLTLPPTRRVYVVAGVTSS